MRSSKDAAGSQARTLTLHGFLSQDKMLLKLKYKGLVVFINEQTEQLMLFCSELLLLKNIIEKHPLRQSLSDVDYSKYDLTFGRKHMIRRLLESVKTMITVYESPDLYIANPDNFLQLVSDIKDNVSNYNLSEQLVQDPWAWLVAVSSILSNEISKLEFLSHKKQHDEIANLTNICNDHLENLKLEAGVISHQLDQLPESPVTVIKNRAP